MPKERLRLRSQDDAMESELAATIERLFKAFVFVPCVGLLAWWLFGAWLDGTLAFGEAAVGLTLLAAALLLGAMSITSGGWGFLTVLGAIYLALLGVTVWQYVYWRRREREYLRGEIERYHAALARDPANAAAYAFLGKAHLALGNPDEAVAALEQAVAMEPESRSSQSLLRQARDRQAHRTRGLWRRRRRADG